MIISDILKNLSNSDKNELLKALTSDLNQSKSTKHFHDHAENNFKCPHCGHEKFTKNGKVRGTQRYICKNHTCKRTFSLKTNTIFHKTQKSNSIWLEYIKLMFEGHSIRYVAKEMEISVPTSFYWRHKILNALRTRLPKKVSGIVEADETMFALSYKGQKKNLPRLARQRGGESKLRGISKDKVSVLIATNRSKKTFSKAICLGRVSNKNLDDNLNGVIESGSIMITDKQKAYRKFCKENSIKLKQLSDSREILEDKYHIQTVNSYHSHLKKFMDRFNGVATKYLDNYLAFFEFFKRIASDPFEEVCKVNKYKSQADFRAMGMSLI